MTSATYYDSFSAFTHATDEKQVFADFVAGQCASRVKSLLDIGPGDGRVTRMILDRIPVQQYTAVEMNPHLARLIQSHFDGRVMTDNYPTERLAGEKFDVVVSIYSLPIDVDLAKAFVNEMITHTAEHGDIITITYGDYHDDWWVLRNALNDVIDIHDLRGFDEDSEQAIERDRRCQELLQEAGKTRSGVLTSQLSAKGIDDFFSAVSFLLSAGEEEMLRKVNDAREKILPILKRYEKDGRYQINMSHSCFVTRRA